MAATTMIPMTAIPPTTPPTMAPIGAELDSGVGLGDGAGVGVGVGPTVALGSSTTVYDDTRFDERIMRVADEDWDRVMARKGRVPVWPLKVVRMVFQVVALVLPQAQSSTMTSGYRVPKQYGLFELVL